MGSVRNRKRGISFTGRSTSNPIGRLHRSCPCNHGGNVAEEDAGRGAVASLDTYLANSLREEMDETHKFPAVDRRLLHGRQPVHGKHPTTREATMRQTSEKAPSGQWLLLEP